MEQATLYYRQSGSDKVYMASIEPKGQGFVVNFTYGRRGSTLQNGSKTTSPVTYEAAKVIFTKLVNEKKAKGYTPGEDGTPYLHTDKEDQNSGIHCQLLNSIGDDEVEKVIADPAYWMQEKFDGRRMLIQKTGDSITGINRLGLKVALPKSLHDDAAACPLNFTIDGEAIGETLHVFDLLAVGEEDLKSQPYSDRRLRLMNLLASFPHPGISTVATMCVEAEKRRGFDDLKAQGREGVVFKKIDQPYTAGRPSTGGPALKFKFHETASFIVTKINAKRSVSLTLYNDANEVPAGNVTIPPNREVPAVGAIIEARYLYAFKESGCIFQPVYLGVRDDIPAEECTVDQLKFKSS